MSDGIFVGVFGVVALIGSLLMGFSMGRTADTHDCDALGKMRHGEVVYVCAKEKK